MNRYCTLALAAIACSLVPASTGKANKSVGTMVVSETDVYDSNDGVGVRDWDWYAESIWSDLSSASYAYAATPWSEAHAVQSFYAGVTVSGDGGSVTLNVYFDVITSVHADGSVYMADAQAWAGSASCDAAVDPNSPTHDDFDEDSTYILNIDASANGDYYWEIGTECNSESDTGEGDSEARADFDWSATIWP
jgi:hypothetical protein